MAHQRHESLSTFHVRVTFEPNRFEQSALQSAYERIVPVIRQTLSTKTDTIVAPQQSESSTVRRREVRI